MAETGKMIPLTQALEIVEQELSGIDSSAETVAVREALGRAIAEDQRARLDLPPFDKSAMDGFAIPQGKELAEYAVIETVPAGSVPSKELTAGTAIKVMTGTAVPKGTSKVVMVEQTSQANSKVRILSHSKANNICRMGEDVRAGDIILRAPAVLGPLEIANLISVGITEVKVSRRVRIAILATGNEIVDSPDELQAGKIMNSNSPMLESLCRKYFLDMVSSEIVTDDRELTVRAIREALDRADIVVLSGGVSVGDYDFVTDAMQEAGLQLHFNRLAVKPGKPMTFASSEDKVAFGLPGNPVAVHLMFHLFVLYASRLMAGDNQQIHYVALPLGSSFSRRKAERMAFLPCRLSRSGMLEPVEYHGTAHLKALLDCDGFFVVSKDVTNISAGTKVDYLSLKGSFG